MGARELYFDAAATTPLRTQVRQRLEAVFDVYGNPSSLHRKGLEAERVMDESRTAVLRCLGNGREANGRLVFTGSGSEANNLAILGVARQFRDRGRHLITTQIEHPSVLEVFRALEVDGWKVSYVKPSATGDILAEDVLSLLQDDTVLVSMMQVNNETGALLPVAEVGAALKRRPKTLFHVDGIQAFGKIPFTMSDLGADLYSLSGHKLGAPKGIGALFLKAGLELQPIVYGGGQQYGLRSGTENILGIAALGAATKAAFEEQGTVFDQVCGLAELFMTGLQRIPGCEVHRPENASPFIIHASFPGLRGEVLVHAFESEGLYVSTGSACSSKDKHHQASHVLLAQGLSAAALEGAIRFSIGYWHQEADVKEALEIIERQTEWLRTLSK